MTHPCEAVTPLDLVKIQWPEARLYDKQKEMIMSVRDNQLSVVVAGNQLGKDYDAGLICLIMFVWPQVFFDPEYVRQIESQRNPNIPQEDPHTRRVLTTSIKDEHLDVLWAEIGRWARTCREPLLETQIVMNHHLIRLKKESGKEDKNLVNYLKGQVTNAEGEGMSGHHGAYTMLVGDESSGLSDTVRKQAKRWAKKELYFGNPNPCRNFFREEYQQGTDKPTRNCIRIRATDSPNVRYAMEEIKRGRKPSNKVIVPGVLTWAEYEHRVKTYNPQDAAESLEAMWYEGETIMLVPKPWLDAAEAFAEQGMAQRLQSRSLPNYLGIDVGEGGDDTCWCGGNRLGVLDLLSLKTPDTNEIFGTTLDKMRELNVPPERVIFDLGGGGREHVDRLRAAGYNVRATGFGKKPALERKRGMTGFEEKRGADDDAYAYVNRRSEMYSDIRSILERDREGKYLAESWNGQAEGFGLPMPMCRELRRQLEPIPMSHDAEGRFKLIPKRDPNDPKNPKTFIYLIGRSPDQADALALMIFGMTHKPLRGQAGAA